MKMVVACIVSCLVLFSVAAANAETYGECRAGCNEEYTDCILSKGDASAPKTAAEKAEPEGTIPKQGAEKNAACEETLQICYSFCKELRPKQ